MPVQHAETPRPEPGHYRAWLNSWALAMRSDGLGMRTVDMYVDAAVLFSGRLLATQPMVHDWE
ncbi:hypothetical protein [Salinispora pacifica]|uniref:hypothetical protein n=1 Tax=Salinispora pacifica TaxID=351187 RepID=UPI0004AFA3F9|nr:hypothetical protein [Salinispora pacifica]